MKEMYEVLFAPARGTYVKKGKKPKVECLFCAIRDKDPRVWTRLVYQDPEIIILMNIFPYSPGHLQVIPASHVKDLEGLSKQELKYFLEFTQRAVVFVKKLMKPQGFNLGINLGKAGGASVEHLHFQLVPRYKNKPRITDQASIHKLYLKNKELLKAPIKPSLKKQPCKCSKPSYVLNQEPLVRLSANPYNRGHLIISPARHVSKIEALSIDELLAIFKECMKAKEAVARVYSPVGFNLGINLGKVPNSSKHLQLHLVPRYEPESGFMEVIGDTRVIVDSLEGSYQKIKSRY